MHQRANYGPQKVTTESRSMRIWSKSNTSSKPSVIKVMLHICNESNHLHCQTGYKAKKFTIHCEISTHK